MRKNSTDSHPHWNIWTSVMLISSVGLVLVSGCDSSAGKPYPSRTVTIICPWAPGGGTDRVARFWADALEKEFNGNPFVVKNRTGGSGSTGHTSGANAKPDGYTITVITAELSTMHMMGITTLTYQDYDCLLQMNADAAAIIVHAKSPWKTLPDMLAAAKADPGQVKMSGTALGGAWDLARAGLQRTANVPIESINWVPTDGAAPSLKELLARELDAVCCSVPEAFYQLESGDLRVLAVMSDERLPDFPDVPTAKEQGFDWVAVGWRGLALPKNTPTEVVDKLHTACMKIAKSDEYQQFMKKNRFHITLRSRDDFRSFLEQQEVVWKDVIEAAGYSKAPKK